MAVAKVVISTEKKTYDAIEGGEYFHDNDDNLCIKDSTGDAIRLSDGEDVTSEMDDDQEYEVVKGGSSVKIDI